MTITELLASLVEVFPHPPMTGPRLNAYRLALSDLTPDECERAFVALARDRDRKFYPTPGEILEAVRPSVRAVDVAPLFDQVEHALLFRGVNTYAEIEERFGVGVANAVRATGGINRVKRFDEGREWTLKRFTEAYTDTLDRLALAPADHRVGELIATTVKQLGRGEG